MLINSNHLVIQLVDSKKMIDTPQMIFFFKYEISMKINPRIRTFI